MRHILSVLVENKPGVLSRVTGLISRRGFNIESLSVGPTEDPTMSRVTAIVKADEVAYEQITKQLHKLISVHKILSLIHISKREFRLSVRATAYDRGIRFPRMADQSANRHVCSSLRGFPATGAAR